MTARHLARQISFQFLYFIDPEIKTLTPNTLSQEVETFFNHFQVSTFSREFAKRLICGVIAYCAELDLQIEQRSKNWKIQRMSRVDRSLLRLALFELLYGDDTPKHVVIDEAIELAKEFGSEESASFVNGILDASAASLQPSLEPSIEASSLTPPPSTEQTLGTSHADL